MEQFQLDGQKGRLDRVLSDLMNETSRSSVQKLIKDHYVTVNGKEEKANYKLKGDEVIQVTIPEVTPIEVEAEDIPLDIVYEDDYLLVVDKPAGMVVHPSKGHSSGTLVNALMYYLGENLSFNDDPIRPGIVHRLDKDTSGLLLVAKNNHIHQLLSEQFQDQSVKRIYQAIVAGVIEEERGTIEIPLARDHKHRLRWAANENGKYALTLFEVKKRLDGLTWVELELKTGRTHQIRVHMEYINHPVIGDPVYRRGLDKAPEPYRNIDSGQYLHCGLVGFVHPVTKEYMEMTSPLPEKIAQIVE